MAISSTNRLTGLFSGMDTASIVKGMLLRTQSRIDREYQQKVKIEWQLDMYREVNKKISSFRSTHMSVLDNNNNMLSSGVYQVYNVKFLGGNEQNAVSIKAAGAPVNPQMTIDKIDQLATAASVSSNGKVSGGAVGVGIGESNYTTLANLNFTNDLTFENGQVSFAINGETFTFNDTDTLQHMINTVNQNEKAGVTMTYSRLTDQFTVSSKKMGAESTLDIQNIKGNAFGAGGAFGIDPGNYQNGQNAQLSISGVAVEMQGNTFTIDGIEYTLNATTANPITFKMEQDISGVVDKVKNFITAYNEMVKYIDDMISETSVKGFSPLTDSMKESMSEKEIEMWETQAKKGLMRSDSNMASLLSGLRENLYTQVAGLGLSPSDIGFKTGDWREKGQIQFDEAAFKAALEKDPDGAIAVLNSVGGGVRDDSAAGLFAKISNQLLQYTKDVQDGSMYERGQVLSRKTKDLETLQDKMAIEEERAWAKISMMEKMLSQMQSQSSWFASQLGSNQ